MKADLYKKYVDRMNSMESVKALFAKPHLVRRAALIVAFDRQAIIEKREARKALRK